MKLAIQGHSKRGKEVIQILESLGGINNALLNGSKEYWYFINSDGYIRNDYQNILIHAGFKTYTLEEFEKEFPFKIGDRVITITTNLRGIITNLKENGWYYVKCDNGHFVCIFGQHLKLYKEMKEGRNITLTLDKAQEWYKKGGELKEIALQAYSEEELNPLPRSWEEFCKTYPVKNGECIIESEDRISVSPWAINVRRLKTWIPSKKSAEAYIAMIQLEQLRNCWLNGWTPKWDVSEKWCIRLYKNQIHVGICTDISRFLTFPTREMAEEFLRCFKDLIEKARDLI